MTVDALSGSFADPVLGSQTVFRALLSVLSRPGTIARLLPGLRPPPPLNAAAAAVLCTLADADTPVYLDGRLAGEEAVAAWIGFHTGARLVAGPADAGFAAIAEPEAMPPLALFRQGTDEYPDRSTTIILQVEGLSGGVPLLLQGPGVAATAQFAPHPLPKDLAEQLGANRQLFPRGVDLVFAAPDAIAGLPRSTRVTEGRA
ncbi:MAG: phosphonate C-P lyase system protein PhnH [Bauldia sp.]